MCCHSITGGSIDTPDVDRELSISCIGESITDIGANTKSRECWNNCTCSWIGQKQDARAIVGRSSDGPSRRIGSHVLEWTLATVDCDAASGLCLRCYVGPAG